MYIRVLDSIKGVILLASLRYNNNKNDNDDNIDNIETEIETTISW